MKYVKNFSVVAKVEDEDKLIEAFSELEGVMIRREYRRLITKNIVELWYRCDVDNITAEHIAELSTHIKCILHFNDVRET